MGVETTFEPRITALEGHVYGRMIENEEKTRAHVEFLESEVTRLVEKVATLEAENCEKVHIEDLQWMIEQKIDYALREIRNAVLDGSLTEMSEQDFTSFITMVSRTEDIPW